MSRSDPRATCETCAFWHQDPDAAQWLGECRATSPAMTRECRTLVGDNQELHVLASFPVTVGNQWCGDHRFFDKPKPDA